MDIHRLQSPSDSPVNAGRRSAVLGGASALLCIRAPAHAQVEQSRTFLGRATHGETGRWLYNEEHRQVLRDGRWWAGSIRYVSPTGDLLAEKTLDFSQDRFIPLARTVIRTTGVEERITRIDAQSVTMETLRDGRIKTRQVERAPVMAADSGFHAFIQSRLDELIAGKSLQLAFGVISQHATFKFRIRRTALRQVGGQQQAVIVAEPDSLLRLLVDPLDLVYDARTRDLLEYNGLSNLDDPQTGKPPKVKIVYEFPAA
ncbi:MAG: hypothetical protein ACO27E_04510 [Burkholderiaceae bacterium]|jgi:hypothetical protein